jgi:hypothetical protein
VGMCEEPRSDRDTGKAHGACDGRPYNCGSTAHSFDLACAEV